ncbi:MAG: hypothetical protein RLZ25_509 [Pseudomonadota bacterium]
MKPANTTTPFRKPLLHACIWASALLAISFSLSVAAALSEVEPNENEFAANALPWKQPIYGQLYSELDQDYFIYRAVKGSPKSVNAYFQCSNSQGALLSGTGGYLIRVFSPMGLQASYSISEALCTNTFGFVMPTPKSGGYAIAISAPPQLQGSNGSFAHSGLGYVLAVGSRSVTTGFCPPGKSPTQVPIPATPEVCGRTWLEFCHPTALQCL